MNAKVFILIFSLGCLSGCQEPAPKIVKNVTGDKTAKITSEGCTIELLSFNASHLRIEGPSDACDPAAKPLADQVIGHARAIMKSYPQKQRSIRLEIYMPNTASVMQKWARLHKDSPELTRRHELTRKETAIPSSPGEYVFDAYDPLISALGYKMTRVNFEKIHHGTAGEYSYFEQILKPLGYTRRQLLPVPFMTGIILEES